MVTKKKVLFSHRLATVQNNVKLHHPLESMLSENDLRAKQMKYAMLRNSQVCIITVGMLCVKNTKLFVNYACLDRTYFFCSEIGKD